MTTIRSCPDVVRPLLSAVVLGSAAALAPVAGEPAAAVDAALVDRGNLLIRNLGCTACHETATPAGLVALDAGPDLRAIASKVDPEWAVEYLLAPRTRRPHTSAPHYFEASDADEVRNVVAFLWQASSQAAWPPAPDGDARRGAELFETHGCPACHVRDADEALSQVSALRLHGPPLANLTGKVSPAWLYAWLRNSRAYAPESRMPNLRLSDSQSADLTAFLLQGTAGRAAVGAGVNLEEADAGSGREAIRRYRCVACHRISGFENTSPRSAVWASIGTFVGHDGDDLPRYDLDGAELAAIRAAANARRSVPADAGDALAAGRAMVDAYNCRGCHLVEGRGRAIGVDVENVGLLPPDLSGEGSRVNPDWLARYLVDPGAIRLRAWLSIEMPSFGFSPEQAQALVDYFTALETEPMDIAPMSPPDPRTVELGREAFDLMPCSACHPYGRQAAEETGLDAEFLAPPLEISSRRLRYGWISSWLADPQRWSPGTSMPTFFPLREGIPTSPFGGLADNPSFAEEVARMRRHVDSTAELEAFLDDGQVMIDAIRDYVWSLEPPGDQ